MIYIIIFIFGLIIGSFLNAIIHRLYTGESLINSRSKCPKCQQQIKWYDLVPVFSWIILIGKCRSCKEKISLQYPLVEISVALLFVIGYYRLLSGHEMILYDWLDFLYYIVAVSFLVVIFVYDHRHSLILDSVSIPLMVIAIVFNLLLGRDIINFLIAGLIGLIWFAWQYVLSKGTWVGGGDLRLGLVMGLLLGWPNILAALWLAYMLGAIISIYLLATKKKDRKSQLPFGTFLSLATVIIWLWGDILINWYLSFF